MKILYSKTLLLISIFLLTALASKAQQNEDLLNILIKKNLITQSEADSIRSEQAVKAQAKLDKDKVNQHTISIGSKALQISGLLQERYQGFEQKGVNDAFDLHRARLIVQGNISDRWSYYTQTELGGTGVKLVDAYTAYKLADYFKVAVGQFKIPFSLESLTPDAQLEFIDRSQVVEALAGRSKDVIGNQQGRDIGITIGGSFAKVDQRYLFDYTLGIFNGAGYDVTTDNNDRKDWAARLAFHPIANLDLGADIYEGKGIPTGATKDQARNRYGFDGRYVIGPLSFNAEYDHGTDAAVQKDGLFGQVAYFIIPQIQIAAKYDTYDPNKVNKTDRAKIYTGGVNFFFNKFAKLSFDYLDRREEAATQVKNNIFEAQLQLVF